ncbi:MAG: sialate O-acetylesterase [Opitutaceae bacterium]|nr:sialate O-acetylesterase [Opitutaceae bacterium]
MPCTRQPLVAVLLFVALSATKADVTLAPLFTDHAVLQRGKLVPVWGRADAGEKITAVFAGQTASATAGSDGRWLVYLQPLAAIREGADLVITGKNKAILRDVVVGEVWLCSGQSNMFYPVFDPPTSRIYKAADGHGVDLQNAAAEVAAAKFPLIRQFEIGRVVAETPAASAKGEWAVCSPEAVGRFTAVGYFFARDIHQELGVPVGIINSTRSGTQIESWMSPAALASDPAFKVVGERWQKTLAGYSENKAAYDLLLAAWTKAEAAALAQGTAAHSAFLKMDPKPSAPQGPGSSLTPAGLFNGMINPLLPYAIQGVLWYQGESNAPRAGEYHALFAAMITAWRTHFGQGDFPFYWVSLANFGNPSDQTGKNYAFLREAQAQALTLPNTGQALAIDIGDRDNIHPANKQEVGRRLALLAKTRIYGFPGEDTGPTFARANRVGATLRVRFTHGAGLTARDKPVRSLEVAGADKEFHPATAKIIRDTLLVSTPAVKEPVAVRYAWSNSPEANLYNGAGLPAVPFRSDKW